MITKVFGVKNRVINEWLHIRRFDAEGKLLTTADWRDAWCSFEDQAISHAAFLQPSGGWVAEELPEFDFDALKAYSDCKMGWREATQKSGVNSYSNLLSLLGTFNLPFPSLPPEIVKKQVTGLMQLLAENEGLPPKLTAVISRKIGTHLASIFEDGNEITCICDLNPKQCASWLTENGVYFGLVTSDNDDKFTDAVKSEMRRLWDSSNGM